MATPENPLVSVSIITYQHAAFITECLEGVLAQKTDFEFEILIGEDGSTDGTREICIEYAERFPDKIRLFLHNPDRSHPKNDVAPWMHNWLNNLQQAKGKYIAICEGDDYWTDPSKLQKQVNFLEKNSDYVICFHSINYLENGVIDEYPTGVPNETTTVLDLCKGNYIQTLSCLFRNNLFDKLPDYYRNCPTGDYFLFLLIAEHGKIKYLNDNMAVYRKHDGGIWSPQSMIERTEKSASIHNYIRAYFDGPIKNALTEEYCKRLERIIEHYRSENNHLKQYKLGINNPYYIAEHFRILNIVKGFILKVLRLTGRRKIK
jgi:glycosyltransferase involved in cell wall biosynthesis